LPSSCCRWRSATSWGLALFSHRSASRIFIMQPGCSPPSAVTQDDDRRPRGGEERAGSWPLPCPQLQGCSSFVLGRRASRVGSLPSAWAGDPLLPSAFGGEGRPPALWGRRTSTCCQSGCGCPSTARATVAPCAGRPCPRPFPCRRPHRGVAQHVVRREGGVRVLGQSRPCSCGEDGSEDLPVRIGATAIRRCGVGA
jgi:hypothetical protein